ncbi:MAG: L,D-transpeptidase [Bacteroides sp.]|nr:L,D-transpeptidase [Bacteroides sp.]
MKTRTLTISLSMLLIVIVACITADGSRKSDNREFLDSVAQGDAGKEILIKSERDSSYHFSNREEMLRFMTESTHAKDYAQGILPQMVNDEYDYAKRLLENTHDGFIVVDKGRMKVIKFDKYGKEVTSFGMACAKNYGNKHKGWDCRTPEGFFSVKKIQNSESWHYVDENGVESPKTGEFGPRFIRLNTPQTNSIGIHGTCAPWSIGGRRSHGCIRVTNENIMKLVEMVDSGMPVIITPGKKDMAVNAEEGCYVPSIKTVVEV